MMSQTRNDSTFMEDEQYENIKAPKWVDFLAPEEIIDDDAWFCKPDCRHPKTAEDFSSTSSFNKQFRFDDKAAMAHYGACGQRDPELKRRGYTISDNAENMDPNQLTSSAVYPRSVKEATKLNIAGRKEDDAHNDPQNQGENLKRALSSRNLFVKIDILSPIVEFCNELKKIATSTKVREGSMRHSVGNTETVEEKKEVTGGSHRKVLGEIMMEKGRRPLIEKPERALKRKQEKIGEEDVENMPSQLNLVKTRSKGNERVLQTRTNPPSPQCFSSSHSTTIKSPLSKSSRHKLADRGCKGIVENKMWEKAHVDNDNGRLPLLERRETSRGLDVFWFFKPCALYT